MRVSTQETQDQSLEMQNEALIKLRRRWEAAVGHRRYDLAKPRPEMFRAAVEANRRTVAYARVLSHDQKDELERQA